jgi:YfiR/HmsC-like
MGCPTIKVRTACTPRQKFPPWWSIVLLAALFVPWLPISTRAQEALQLEQQKATYLRNILGFVQWPASAAGNGSRPLQLCVEGEALLAFALTREFRAADLDHRKVEVRSLRSERELPGCSVLVIGRLDSQQVARILVAAAGTQVMTFGQTDGFLEAGGAVQFTRKQNALQFSVNLKATNKARVKLDARLLDMAKRVLQDADTAGG